MNQVKYTIIFLVTLLVLATPTLAETTYIQTQNGANQSIGNLPLFLDNSNNRLGVGTTTPDTELSVNGSINQFINKSPTKSGTATSLSNPHTLQIAGDYAYVADRDNYLFSLDISDSNNPNVIDSISTSALNSAYGVDIQDDYAYVASYSNNLVIIDISDPTNLTQVSSFTTSSMDNAREVDVVGSTAYVVSRDSNSLTAVDVSNPTDMKKLGNISTGNMGSPYGVEVRNGYAFISSWDTNTVNVIDISDPANMEETDAISTGSTSDAWDLDVQGRYLYLAPLGSNGLTVIDVQNVSDIQQVGEISTNIGGSHGVKVAGRYAYVTGGNAPELSIVDVSNVSNPTVVASNSNIDGFMGIDIKGEKLVGTSYSSGEVYTVDLPATKVPNLEVGNAQIGSLRTSDDIKAEGVIQSQTGLATGGSIVGREGISSGDDSFIGGELNVTGNITSNSGTVCTTNNGLCNQTKSDSTGGWTNTSTVTNTSLNMNVHQTGNTSNSTLYVNTTSGDVGVGTSEPSVDLHVTDGDLANILINSTDDRSNAYLTLNSGGLVNGNRKDRALVRYQTENVTYWHTGLAYNGGSDNTRYSISPTDDLSDAIFTVEDKTDGNVGIGNQDPQAHLHIGDSNAGGSKTLLLEKPSFKASLSADLNNYFDISINGTQTMVFQPSGNVGIGTTSPGSLLDVSGTAQATTSFETGDLVLHNSDGLYKGNSNRANVRFGSEKTNGARPLILESGDNGSYTDGDIRLETDGEERVRVDDQGNVGVGTSSPNQSVEVDGGVRLNTTKTKPTCSNEQRGTMWFEKANAGSDDIIYSCMKNSSDSYNWVMVARGG